MSTPSVPRNPEFEHLRHPPDGLCRWCGAPATTSEHKFKRSDLELMGGDGAVYWGGDSQRLYLVRSVKKSASVRFDKSLCARCNNARSQPFDRAYDIYRDYVLENLNVIWGRRRLDMKAVYGKSWPSEQANLARYFVKHCGCRLIYEGISPPLQMSEFLNGEPTMPSVQLAFVALADEKRLRDSLAADQPNGGTILGLGGFFCRVTRDRSRFSQAITATYISYLGVRFEWSTDAAARDTSFFPYRSCHIDYFNSDEGAAFPPPGYNPETVSLTDL